MDDLFGLIVIIIGIAAGIYSDKKKKRRKTKESGCAESARRRKKNVPQTQVSYGGHAGRPDVLADAANAMQRDLSVRQQELEQRLQAEVWHGCIEYGKAHAGSAPCFKSRKRCYFKTVQIRTSMKTRRTNCGNSFMKKQGSRRKKYTGSVRTNVP